MKKGWKIKTLGELCEINIGRTPSRSDNSLWDKEKKSHNVWVSIADMPDCPTDTIYETKEYISDKAARNINIIKAGTILLSFKLTLGKTAIAGTDLYTNEAIANLPIKDKEISREYLLYYFRFFDWNSYSSGEEKVKGKTLNKKKLDVLPIYYPSLSEQQAIVSRLDSAFAKIDAVKANAEKQLNDAKALFQKELSKAMIPKEGWEEKKLGEVCRVINGRAYSKEEMLDKGKYRLLRVGNFFTNDTWYYSDLELDEDKYCDNGDLLYAWSASFGPRIWDGEKVIYHYHIWKMECSDDVDKRYMFYWLDSDVLKKQALTNLHGSTMAHITKAVIEKSIVGIPPLSEQQAIVSHLDTLSEKLKTVEERQKTIMAECDAMKQALLREVFE